MVVQLNVIKVISDYYKGAIHLHGHQHNMPAYNRQQVEAGLRRFDVGVDANGFKPINCSSLLITDLIHLTGSSPLLVLIIVSC